KSSSRLASTTRKALSGLFACTWCQWKPRLPSCSTGKPTKRPSSLQRGLAPRVGWVDRSSVDAVSTRRLLLEPHADEHGVADRAEPEHLERVPDAEDDQEVKPARPTDLKELEADRGGVEVGFGEEHHWNAPFQAASGVARIAQDVGR